MTDEVLAPAAVSAGSLPMVAVLLAAYNGKAWIGEQIDSILAQSDVRVKIFVSVDLSQDGTEAYVDARAKADTRIIPLPHGRHFGGAAPNFLRLLTESDLTGCIGVAFADQDDVWFPGKLARALRCLEKSGAAGYSSDLLAFDTAQRRAWYLAKSTPMRSLDYLFQGASAGCTYVLSATAASLVRAALTAAGRDASSQPSAGTAIAEQDRRSHDWLIYAICRSHGLGWFQDAQAAIAYRQHTANAFGAQPGWHGLWRRLVLARSGWYRAHVLWLRSFLAGSAAENEILLRVGRLSFFDRIWLAWRSSSFRRTRRDACLLAIILLLGFF